MTSIDEVETIEIVQHRHVERRGRRAFLLVAAHVKVVVIGAAIGQAMDQPGIAVKGEDDRLVLREQRVEVRDRSSRADARVGGCSVIRSTTLIDADFQLREMLAQDQIDRGQSLQRRHIAAARHDDIRLAHPDRCWPIPRCRFRRCSA